MTNNEQVVIMYVPCGGDEEAATIARALLREGLIACANIYASRSLYRWQGEVADETEYVLFAKTTASQADTAARLVEQLHSYDIPAIVTIRADSVNDAYAAWVAGELSNSTSLGLAPTGTGSEG
jgi:periplasmic divalent cation tolerance protein